ncbi:hypothetical protein GE061_003713 [Apolygus lucorum]|uniref:Uncharacterized protein n=1 Tax=Apolygus lucorum TaxID=248454 RepID=A0A6A4JDY9_APOLU|nr:hypothetical protein GE061_003713 [Apolygus lucorum]
MRTFWVFACVLSCCSAAKPEFKPSCTVVSKIDSNQDPVWAAVDKKDYPIAVCIAGYSNYFGLHDIKDKNGVRRVGWFRTREVDLEKCTKAGDPAKKLKKAENLLWGPQVIKNEVRCLANTVLNSEETMRFYRKLCQPHLVRNVTCELPSGSLQVFDPIHRKLADRIDKGETDLNDDLIKKPMKNSTSSDAPTSR